MGHGFRFTSFGVVGIASPLERTAFAAEAVVALVADDAVLVIAARPFRSRRNRHDGRRGGWCFR